MLLVHPYAKTVKLEADLAYAVRCSASLRPDALRISSERFKVLRQLARTCSPADSYLLSLRHTQHVKGMRPLFTSLVEAGLRWPDKGHPSRLISGFEIVNKVPSSGLFRPIEEPEPFTLDTQRLSESLQKLSRNRS